MVLSPGAVPCWANPDGASDLFERTTMPERELGLADTLRARRDAKTAEVMTTILAVSQGEEPGTRGLR